MAAGDPRAKRARDILSRYGIDIDDVDNGVFLPTSTSTRSKALRHPKLHTTKYYREINERLEAAGNREEALNALNDIKDELLKGTLPR